MKVIYADTLVILNTAVDYLLLLCAGKLCALPLRRGRIALGALWGGLYALGTVIWPEWFALLASKLAAGAAAVVIAYGFERRTPRALAAFFAVAAAFGGAVYAAAGLAGLPPGSLYVPVSAKVLLLSFALCYAAVALVFRRVGKRTERRLHAAEVTLNGVFVSFPVLHDSGNELHDPLTGADVLVAQSDAIAPLFGMAEALSLRDAPAAMEALSAGPYAGRFRLLPCTCVTAETALLLCFRPDAVFIDGRRRELLVAVTPNRLSPDGEFQALL